MRFVFYPVNCCPFHGKTLEERPLGGTETAIIRLSQALDALGHEVFVATLLRKIPPTKPIYIAHSVAKHLEGIDVLIVVRGLGGLLESIPCKNRFFWTGDAWTNRHTFGIGDKRYADRMDAFLAVSEWHANTICTSSGFPLQRTFILRNGVQLPLFEGEEVRRKRLIYSSSPGRGLIFLAKIFPLLLNKHPDLELHIFSSSNIYSRTWPPQTLSRSQDDDIIDLFKQIPHCYPRGSVIQSQLAREFMRSSILVYPTGFEETSCITAMEAQAGGCVPVSTDLAAMKETVGEAGILIDEKPGSTSYIEKYVSACDQLLSDASLLNHFSSKAKEKSKSSDWKLRAEELVAFVNKRVS